MNVHRRSMSCEKTEAQILRGRYVGSSEAGREDRRPQVGQSESSGNLDEEKSSLSASAQVLHDSCTGFPQNDANDVFEPKTDPADRMNALNRMNLVTSSASSCLPASPFRKSCGPRAGRHDFPDFHARWQRVRQLRRVRETGRQRHLLDARRWSARSAASSGGDGQDEPGGLGEDGSLLRLGTIPALRGNARRRGLPAIEQRGRGRAEHDRAVDRPDAGAGDCGTRAGRRLPPGRRHTSVTARTTFARSSRCSIRRSRRCARSAAEIPSSCRSSRWLALPTSSRCSGCRT